MSDKPGVPPENATVITVSPGKPQHVADLTSACHTAAENAPSPAPDDPMPVQSNRGRQPGRMLAPIQESEPSSQPVLLPASDARILPLQPVPAIPAVPGGSEMTPLRLLAAFRRCWGWAIGLGLLAAAIVGPAAWFLLPPPKFVAESVLQVYSRPPVIAFSIADTSGGAGDEYKRYQKTQIALIKSRLVLLSVLQKKEIAQLQTIREHASDPVEWLKKNLDVSFQGDSEILQIALKGDHPADLAALVNAITDAYMQEVVNVERNLRTQRYDTLKEIIAKKQKMLESQRDRVKKLAEDLGSNNQQALVLKQQLAAENQAMLDKELLEIHSKKRRTEAELAARLRLVETVAETPGEVDDDEVEAMLDQEPSIIALQQQLDDAEYAYGQHANRLRNTARNPSADPMINQLKLAVRRARNELNQRRKALRPIVLRKYQTSGPAKGPDSVASLRRDLEVMQDLEKRIEAERGQFVAQAKTANTQNLTLQSIQDDIEQSETAASKMGAEVQSLEIELLAPGRVKKIEDAQPPVTSDIVKRYMMIAMATLGAFFAVVGGLTFWELQSHKVGSATEIAGGLGLRLIGTLPALPVRARRGGSDRGRSQELLLERLMYESIDVTRTMLLNATLGQTGRVVTVTSAMGGEGKTSLSCHLASSLARSGRKTLLVDADLRNPSIHRLFDQPLTPGLSEALRGEHSFEEAIVPSSVPYLDLICAGDPDTQTMRSLSQGGIVPLLDRLRERYDCVIIDTAPVLPITDTLLIAPYTDVVIFAVLSDVSRAHKVAEARQRLTTVGAKVLGAVFTGVRPSVYGKDYRYRYVRDVDDGQTEEPSESESSLNADA
ncbi:MAG: polysaccharide biosynthesis tyrosine autokinase [Isosphaeraceae bacterium]